MRIQNAMKSSGLGNAKFEFGNFFTISFLREKKTKLKIDDVNDGVNDNVNFGVKGKILRKFVVTK